MVVTTGTARGGRQETTNPLRQALVIERVEEATKQECQGESWTKKICLIDTSGTLYESSGRGVVDPLQLVSSLRAMVGLGKRERGSEKTGGAASRAPT